MESNTIEIILEEIRKRIAGYEEQMKIKKAESLDKIQAEFHTNLDALTINDLIYSTTTTKNKLIEIINFDKRDFDLKSDEGLFSLFEKIKSYIKLNNERIINIQSDINNCQIYYTFFNGIDEVHDLFGADKQNTEEFKEKDNKKDNPKEELLKFVKSLGINLTTRVECDIEKYIAEYNLKARVIKDKDPEITNSVTSIYRDLYNYDDVKDFILDYVRQNLNNKVDLNLMDKYFEDMSKLIDKTKETIGYVFYMMILGQSYFRYLKGPQEKTSDNLSLVHRVLQEYTFDKMDVIRSEANKIINMEMSSLRGRYIDFEEVVVTDAISQEEFEELKNKKKAIIASLINKINNDYDNVNDLELKENYKKLISDYIKEYYNTNRLTYKELDYGRAR